MNYGNQSRFGTIWSEGDFNGENAFKNMQADSRTLRQNTETNYMSYFTYSQEGAFVSESSGVSPQNICAALLWQRAWGVPEVVAHGETGLLVETNDSYGIAEATLRLLECPELATQIGQAARRRAQRMFSWRHMSVPIMFSTKKSLPIG